MSVRLGLEVWHGPSKEFGGPKAAEKTQVAL